VLGIAILASHRSASPMNPPVSSNNETIFDIPKIENRINEISAQDAYERLLLGSTRLFATSFFFSSLLNLCLANWLFSVRLHAINALETYNAIVAKVVGWAFAVIGVPSSVFLFLPCAGCSRALRSHRIHRR